MNEQGHEQEAAEAEQSVPPIVSEEPKPHPPMADIAAESGDRNTENKQEKVVLQSIQASTASTNWSNWIIAFATVVNMCVAFVQWRSMDTNNSLTVRAIEAAETANRISDDALRASMIDAEADRAEAARMAELERTDRAHQFKETIKTSRDQASAGRELVRRQLEQGEIQRRNLELIERSAAFEWRSLLLAGEVTYLQPDEDYVWVTITNIGHSPATATFFGESLIGGHELETPSFAPDAKEEFLRNISPGEGFDLPVLVPGEIRARSADLRPRGIPQLVIRGFADYSDETGTQRRVIFCYVFWPVDTWIACASNNKTEDRQQPDQ